MFLVLSDQLAEEQAEVRARANQELLLNGLASDEEEASGCSADVCRR
jgi:hypothetical protein